MNDGRNGDACCVRMLLLLLFPQPASCCLGTLCGIRQPQPNGTYSKDDFRRFNFFPSPYHGFWWRLHFNQRLDVSDWFQRIVFAESLAVIWGDLSYRRCRFYLPEILLSYLVVLTILSLTSTTGSPLPFLAAFHQSDSCLPDAKLTLHASHSLILGEKYISFACCRGRTAV